MDLTAFATLSLITFPAMRCVFWDQESISALSQAQNRGLISSPTAGEGVTSADSWNTRPKELSLSLKAMVQSRGVTMWRGVCSMVTHAVFGGAANCRTLGFPAECSACPALPGNGEAGHVIRISCADSCAIYQVSLLFF